MSSSEVPTSKTTERKTNAREHSDTRGSWVWDREYALCAEILGLLLLKCFRSPLEWYQIAPFAEQRHIHTSPKLITTERSTCGVFHHKSRSPQVLVVILFMVGLKVREHSTSGANMFDSMCT